MATKTKQKPKGEQKTEVVKVPMRPKNKAPISAVYVAEEDRSALQGKLGSIVLYSIGEKTAVPIEEVDKFWEENDVPNEWKPEAPSASAAFSRTCMDNNCRIWYAIEDAEAIKEFERAQGMKEGTVRVEYMTARTAGKNDEYILIRRMWMKQEGGDDMVPTHPNLAKLRFREDEDRIEVIAFPEYEGTDIIANVEKVANEHYQFEKGIINGPRHRKMVISLLERYGGTPFMGKDATWFVPTAGEEALAVVEKYIDEVVAKYRYSNYEVGMMLIDAVDTEKMKEQIAKDIAKEVEAKWEELSNGILDTLNGNYKEETLERKLDAKRAEAERIGVKLKTYEDLLGRKLKMSLAVKPDKPLTGRVKAMVDAINDTFAVAEE